MIRPEQIPDEVVEAARVAWLESASDYNRLNNSMRASIAAALAAWPGMLMSHAYDTPNGWRLQDNLILPIPEAPQERISTENSDE